MTLKRIIALTVVSPVVLITSVYAGVVALVLLILMVVGVTFTLQMKIAGGKQSTFMEEWKQAYYQSALKHTWDILRNPLD